MSSYSDPHAMGALLTAGAPLATAKAVMIMVHGRGASAQSILELASNFDRSEFAYLAPQAANYSWYPNSFLYPLEENEPYLSSALNRLESLVAWIEEQGVKREDTMILGFSQGACLSLEYAARHAGRFGGIIGLSGGLIGPEGTSRNYAGVMDRTPVFLGCSDTDFHIPKERVIETAVIFQKLGAIVTKRLYPNMGHGINQDELDFVRQMMRELMSLNNP